MILLNASNDHHIASRFYWYSGEACRMLALPLSFANSSLLYCS